MAKADRTTPQTTTTRRFITQQRLSEISGRGPRTLEKDRFYGNGPFPYYKIGKSVVYDEDECIRIIESTRIGPARLASEQSLHAR